MFDFFQREALASENIESRVIIEADLQEGSGRRHLIINELENLRYTDNRLIITRRLVVPVYCETQYMSLLTITPPLYKSLYFGLPPNIVIRPG